MLVQFFTSLFF
ncbi:unnamed protein product [Acanthoscelides obtectus]|uniref:Uncharacterized protein n=1 Tax=Acanthoscelides obtectus TaxID=200917 RepID=A0A9P0P6T1_ACAOB|nr:unnamed protein product [Acanthoscelides obtectus]CAK1632344.1 hypothetical protein AOBTE_LOCUS7492 [Acanthoscelides obtectus]